MNKEQKNSKTIRMNADHIRDSVTSKLYSVQGDPIWFRKDEGVTYHAQTKEIEIPLKLAKKKFPNENF